MQSGKGGCSKWFATESGALDLGQQRKGWGSGVSLPASLTGMCKPFHTLIISISISILFQFENTISILYSIEFSVHRIWSTFLNKYSIWIECSRNVCYMGRFAVLFCFRAAIVLSSSFLD